MNGDMIKSLCKNVEANVVCSLFSKPEQFLTRTEIKKDDFVNPMWAFYYTIGRNIAAKGVTSITSKDVDLYMDQLTNEKLKDAYAKYNKFNTIENYYGLFDETNLDVYIADLKKWSSLYKMHTLLTDGSEKLIDMMGSLTTNDLYNFFTAKFNNIFANVNEDVRTVNINEGLEQLIEDSNKGMKKGLPIDSPILSDMINGINLGQITLIGGQSGSGKSTWLIQQILVSVFQNEESAVFFLNEQDASKFQQEMLTWIINNVVIKDNTKKFNKVRWRDGSFTEEEFEWMYEAKRILEEKTKNNKIIIVEFKTYCHATVIRCIKQYAAMGVKIFSIDTFKLSSDIDKNSPYWLALQEQMKELDDLIKPANLNVALVCTLQLGKGAILNRYLSANDLGMSKNIIDVASVCLLIRKVHADEYDRGEGFNNSNVIKVFKIIEGTENSREEMPELDNRCRHSVIFITKNRNGISDTYQVVAKHDFGTMRYEELGLCEITGTSI